MNWKTKALLQKFTALLPSQLGHELYYRLQLMFSSGQLGMLDTRPNRNLEAGVHMAELITRQGHSLEGRSVLEVGTGRRLSLPMALWLCGADEIITVDLNPYLRSRLVLGDIAYMKANHAEVRQIFHPFHGKQLFEDRFSQLLTVRGDLDAVMSLLRLRYEAPADAARLNLPDASVDVHVSSAVMEHISPVAVGGVLAEGWRVLKPDGVMVHLIDFVDHFSYTDPSLSAIHFLRFSPREWEWWSGNHFACQNRLRLDDFRRLFQDAGLRIIGEELLMDERVRAELRNGFPLDTSFRGKSEEILATTLAWLVTERQRG